MEKAFNHNTQLFISTMQMLETQNHAMRQVFDDMFTGVKSGAVKVQPDGTIDWRHYLEIFLAKLREHQAKPPEPPPVLHSPQDEAPFVFGG